MTKPMSLIERVKQELTSKRKYPAVLKKDISSVTQYPCMEVDPEVNTLYGVSNTKKNSLVIHRSNKNAIRLFVFDQNVSGSADEKLPFMYLSGLQAKEDLVIFIVNGEGLRKAAFSWLKNAIDLKLYQTNDNKKIWLKSFEEFSTWLDCAPAPSREEKPKPAPITHTMPRRRTGHRKNKAFNFVTENKYSKEAVKMVEAYLSKKYGKNQLENVENLPQYQKQDVDLVLKLENTNILLEVKSDKHYDTGKIVLEIFSNLERNTPGWTKSTQADFIYYVFPDISTAYVIRASELKDWLIANENTLELKYVKTPVRNGQSCYTTAFSAVPISTILKDLNQIEKIKLN